LFEVASLFITGGLSRRNDTDGAFRFGVGNDDNTALKQAEGQEPCFIVVEAIIKDGDETTLENRREIGEIDPVLAEIGSAFRLVPVEPHSAIVVTRCVYVKRTRDYARSRCLPPPNGFELSQIPRSLRGEVPP